MFNVILKFIEAILITDIRIIHSGNICTSTKTKTFHYSKSYGLILMSTKQSKCLIDNDEDKVLDLEKLFCSDVCFFDPEYYDECPHEHNGQFEIFGKVDPNMPLYKRPKEDKHICLPSIKLAQIKKICPKCKRVFNDHKRNHHILHKACQICSHMKHSPEVSFKLTCCICLKTFKNKYTLSEHMQIHEEENPNYL